MSLKKYGIKISYVIIVMLSVLFSCKERYDPQIEFSNDGFLVVEGYINIGTKAVTTLMLSRTTPVNESNVMIHETGAYVSIENSLEESFLLHETAIGVYISDSLTLPENETYRVKISIADKIYFSEFVTPIITPEIDSVTWGLDPTGVSISVSTHGAINQAQQYQWEYEEVWETQSETASLYDYSGGIWLNRSAQEIKSMKTCWKYVSVTGFNIFSTKHLTQNTVLNQNVKLIPFNSEQLDVRYSIQIKQHVLSDESYNYIQLILSNSENLGTFSDPMPGQLSGNIYCASTNEPVVGYIDAYSTTSKRISIYKEEIPNWDYQRGCRETSVSMESPTLSDLMKGFLAIRFHFVPGNDFPPIRDSVYLMPNYCLDCRINGGTNIRPQFWD